MIVLAFLGFFTSYILLMIKTFQGPQTTYGALNLEEADGCLLLLHLNTYISLGVKQSVKCL